MLGEGFEDHIEATGGYFVPAYVKFSQATARLEKYLADCITAIRVYGVIIHKKALEVLAVLNGLTNKLHALGPDPVLVQV